MLHSLVAIQMRSDSKGPFSGTRSHYTGQEMLSSAPPSLLLALEMALQALNPFPPCSPFHANRTLQSSSATTPLFKPAVGEQPRTGGQHQHCHACLPHAAGSGDGRQSLRPHARPMGAAPLCPARRRSPSTEGSMGPSPPSSPAPAAVSREVVMGTVRCRYPSLWVPLPACHGDSRWKANSGPCRVGMEGVGYLRVSYPPRNAGDTQGWRSPVCPGAPFWVPEHPFGHNVGDGQGGGHRH